MQIGKIKSTSIKKNRAQKEILTCVIEIRKGQNITAEWINNLGESATPIIGDWVLVMRRDQSFGSHFAFGFADVINQFFAARGVKILYGRNISGLAKTKVTLTDSEVIIENPSNAHISLTGGEVILNNGSGNAVEHGRLQTALTKTFAEVLRAEFIKVAEGTEPNPSNPYVPSQELLVDIADAKSDSVKLP